MKSVFGWEPNWNIEIAMEKIVEWFEIYYSGKDVCRCMNSQIRLFLDTC